jgi:hypothetical protein
MSIYRKRERETERKRRGEGRGGEEREGNRKPFSKVTF